MGNKNLRVSLFSNSCEQVLLLLGQFRVVCLLRLLFLVAAAAAGQRAALHQLCQTLPGDGRGAVG